MTAADSQRQKTDQAEHTAINIVPEGGNQHFAQSPSISTSSLVQTQGKFSDFLAPLKKDTFKQVASEVEGRLKVVNQTLSMLDSVLDSQGFDAILNEMLRSIALKTGELLAADRTTIYLLDEDRDELWSVVAKGEDGTPLEIRIPSNKGIAGEVATFKRDVNIPYDFYDDPRSEAAKTFDLKNGYRTYTMLSLPLLSEEGDLVAVVQLINKLKPEYDPKGDLADKIALEGFTECDLQVFREFAPSIRLILESSRLFYKATQRQRAATALISATNSLSKSSLDLDATLKKVMAEAKQLMNAARATLWLIDEEKQDLWTKITLADGTLKELRVPLGVGYAGKVAVTGKPLSIGYDLYNDPDSENSKKTDPVTGFRTCSLLCMPVFNADGELIGVTQLVNKVKSRDSPSYNPQNWPQAPKCWQASFDRTDQEFMTAFNIQAGVALQNAKLFAQVKQQEQMQRDILRSLTNGVISTDKSGRIIAANERAKTLLGFEETSYLEGTPIQDLFQIKEGQFNTWFKDALAAKNNKAREQYYPDRTLTATNGNEHSINLSINSISDASDASNVYGALVVMDDISDEKRLKSTMYRYMTQELAEELLRLDDAKLGGDRKDVSVLFSDIRSYTTLTESLEAEDVVSMLNEYFESMVEAVFKHKGTLDKYIGDAIMAVFGSPLPLEDHPWKAVQTALDMRERLTAFNTRRSMDNHAPISIGIGINSGAVISGNIGSSKRMEFTAIGDGVNIGARLEGATKQYGCDIVISEATYRPCADQVRVRELDRIRAKGKNNPISIFELVGLQDGVISSDKARIIDLYHQGREYYLGWKFAIAIAKFAEILEINNTDKAAQLHLTRCQHFLTQAPPDNWDGVWDLTQK